MGVNALSIQLGGREGREGRLVGDGWGIWEWKAKIGDQSGGILTMILETIDCTDLWAPSEGNKRMSLERNGIS